MLSDCVLKDPSRTELIIAQLGAASAAAKHGRDPLFQAVLPIGATMVPIQSSPLDRVLDDDEARSIIAAIGVGIWLNEGWEGPDMSRLRYGIIILCTDASPEGGHIREQVLALFSRFMRPLLVNGTIYTVDVAKWEDITDDEFRAKVLDPSTRNIEVVEA